MLSKVFSATTVGLDGELITVEVDVASRGFPSFKIVGLPNKAIEESKERVRTAINNSSFDLPQSKMVVNLAPADIPKEGSLFDLPIAIGILTSQGVIDREFLKNSLFVGELSLDGKISPVPGILPIATLARSKNITSLYIPEHNVEEAALIKGITVYGVHSLADLILHLNGDLLLKETKTISWKTLLEHEKYNTDFKDVKGQKHAKRALEIAAAGGHNVLFKGPPGTGKTMLARAFPSIMPAMDEDEIIEVSKIYSVTQAFTEHRFVVKRPFRTPHHTISKVGLIGGGTRLTPGEVSLAHRGVLFLDEFPEYQRSVIESLRQPMEDGHVVVTRAVGTVTFPTRFILIAASNPCPCGYLGHPKRPCHCSMGQIMKYKKKISGPILDRIDIHVDVLPVKEDMITSTQDEEASKYVRKRVDDARQQQLHRFRNTPIKSNAEMSTAHIKKICVLESKAQEMLKVAFTKLSLSARSYFKIIKIAQTITDLNKKKTITVDSISEAIQYRVKEE